MRGKMLKDRAVACGRPMGSGMTDIVGKTGRTAQWERGGTVHVLICHDIIRCSLV